MLDLIITAVCVGISVGISGGVLSCMWDNPVGKGIASGFRGIKAPLKTLKARGASKAQPSTILAELVSLNIIADLPRITLTRGQTITVRGLTLTFSTDFHYSAVQGCFKMRRRSPSTPKTWWLEIGNVRLRAGDNYVRLTGREDRIIKAAIAKAYVLGLSRQENSSEQDRQDGALSAIEVLMEGRS